MNILRLLPIVLVIACTTNSLAKPDEPIDYLSALRSYQRNMQKLLSFAAKVTIVEQSRVTFIKDRENVVETTNLIELQVLSDCTRGLFLMTKNAYSLESSNGHSAIHSSIFLSRNRNHYRDAGAKLLLYEEEAGVGYGFFDPRSIGLGFCADLSRFQSFEDLIEQLLRNRNSKCDKIRDGRAIYGLIDQKGDLLYGDVFSVGDVYCPVEAKHSTLHAKVAFEEVEGIMLPTSAAYYCSSSLSQLVKCEWISINKPIDEARFDPSLVAKCSGLTFQEP